MARSIKKGPFVEERLLKRVEAAKTSGRLDMIRTFSRSSVIIPDMVNMTISVYNGKTWIPVYITENLVGHKLGEFAPTRTFRGHSHDDSSAKKSSAPSAAPAASAAAPAAASAPAPSAEA